MFANRPQRQRCLAYESSPSPVDVSMRCPAGASKQDMLGTRGVGVAIQTDPYGPHMIVSADDRGRLIAKV